jgi:uncharacterized protein
MQLEGTRELPAAPEAVWALLHDPQNLAGCIPGCEAITPDGADRYQVVVAARIGPVSARFRGHLQVVDVQPLVGYGLRFEGQGGVAGFAKGQARIALAPHDAGTRMQYSAQAQVGGKLAQVGSRLVDATAAQLSETFFQRLAARFDHAPPQAEQPATEAAPQPATAAPAAPRRSSPTPWQQWGWWAFPVAAAAAGFAAGRLL